MLRAAPSLDVHSLNHQLRLHASYRPLSLALPTILAHECLPPRREPFPTADLGRCCAGNQSMSYLGILIKLRDLAPEFESKASPFCKTIPLNDSFVTERGVNPVKDQTDPSNLLQVSSKEENSMTSLFAETNLMNFTVFCATVSLRSPNKNLPTSHRTRIAQLRSQ